MNFMNNEFGVGISMKVPTAAFFFRKFNLLLNDNT